MARISTYMNDPTINDSDRLIGTDGGMIGTDGEVVAGTAGATKNFTVESLRAYINANDSNTGGGGSDGSGDYNTNVITESTPQSALQLFTAHAVYVPGEDVRIILPIANSDLETGSWVRMTRLGNTGVINIYAGGILDQGGGNRFMGGISSDGTAVDDPHLLSFPAGNGAAFELIYINDNLTVDGQTAPVGWIIVN